MPSIRVTAKDFRVLHQLDFRPEGVCLLAGANGAGKSTVLMVLKFLQVLFQFGHEQALLVADGIALQHLSAAPEDPVELLIELGDIEWKLFFPMSFNGLRGTYGEVLSHAGKVVIHADVFGDDWITEDKGPWRRDGTRCGAKFLWDRGHAPWMAPLVDMLSSFRCYGPFWVNQVKRIEPIRASDTLLNGDGTNLWSVLANWKGAPIRYTGHFDWVIDEARKAFPDIMGTIEFDRGFPYLYPPGARSPQAGLFPNRAADGLLAGLLHLTAVAGAPEGALITIEEVESQLHPYAIRSVLAAMRDRAAERDLTIILTTHSPVVMNQFRNEPDKLYVLHRDFETQPRRLTELRDEDALAQVQLGELYEQLDFAAPRFDRRHP